MAVLVEVAAGELIDKITILQIKLERIADAQKLVNVRTEHDALQAVYRRELRETPELTALMSELRGVNEEIWNLEDDIRDLERAKDFGERFVSLARSVYRTNDRRAALKRSINELLGSRFVEEKSYSDY